MRNSGDGKHALEDLRRPGLRVKPGSVWRTAGIFEAKKNFSALIQSVEAGEEVRITRHGREVVRMLPVRRQPVITEQQIERELSAIAELHRRIKPGPGWRELRDGGRE